MQAISRLRKAHTTSANNPPIHPTEEWATRARAERLACAIQNSHMGRGWGDTGQHFTIRRGGHVKEGRTGSLAAAERGEMVVGTHVRGANARHSGH